ncbi:MAG: hypothetical protein QW478_09365, partial [Candidatus Micrarchaeaceae archaeon]
LCEMKTILPEDADKIVPDDVKTLRYALRVKGNSGFLFINNYQDHIQTQRQDEFKINIKLSNENVLIPEIGAMSLEKDNSCILPFNINLDGINLKYATAQLITKINYNYEDYYFFFIPSGMQGQYCFDSSDIANIKIENGEYEQMNNETIAYIDKNAKSLLNLTTKNGRKINICTLTEADSLNFWKVRFNHKEYIVITNANLIVSENEFKLECMETENVYLSIFPKFNNIKSIVGGQLESEVNTGIFLTYKINLNIRMFNYEVKPIAKNKVIVNFKDNFDEFKEVLMKIDYFGDIGYAFIENELINDNFYNGSTWEIGLKRFEKQLLKNGMRIYISPVKSDFIINNDSPMAGRNEFSGEKVAIINSIQIVPVYEVKIDFGV